MSGIVDQLGPLLGMTGEQIDRAGKELGHRLGTGASQLLCEAHDFDVTEMTRLAVVAFDLGVDQQREQVVARLCPVLLDATHVVLHRLEDRRFALLVRLDLAGFAVHRRVGPQPCVLHVVLRDAEHRRDDFDGERRGELPHHVELVAVDRAEILVDDRGDRRPLSLDRPRGEQLVQHAAHVAMFRRIHELQQSDVRRRSTGPHHGQVDSISRRVRLGSLERRGDVLVAGERVEVVLLAVVHRRVLSHPPVDLVRVVEELLRERIECQHRRRHAGTVRR